MSELVTHVGFGEMPNGEDVQQRGLSRSTISNNDQLASELRHDHQHRNVCRGQVKLSQTRDLKV